MLKINNLTKKAKRDTDYSWLTTLNPSLDSSKLANVDCCHDHLNDGHSMSAENISVNEENSRTQEEENFMQQLQAVFSQFENHRDELPEDEKPSVVPTSEDGELVGDDQEQEYLLKMLQSLTQGQGIKESNQPFEDYQKGIQRIGYAFATEPAQKALKNLKQGSIHIDKEDLPQLFSYPLRKLKPGESTTNVYLNESAHPDTKAKAICLPNGITCMLLSDPSTKNVSTTVRFGAGRDDAALSDIPSLWVRNLAHSMFNDSNTLKEQYATFFDSWQYGLRDIFKASDMNNVEEIIQNNNIPDYIRVETLLDSVTLLLQSNVSTFPNNLRNLTKRLANPTFNTDFLHYMASFIRELNHRPLTGARAKDGDILRNLIELSLHSDSSTIPAASYTNPLAMMLTDLSSLGMTLKDAVEEFHNVASSTNNLTVSILGPQSIEELESMVRENFNELDEKNFESYAHEEENMDKSYDLLAGRHMTVLNHGRQGNSETPLVKKYIWRLPNVLNGWPTSATSLIRLKLLDVNKFLEGERQEPGSLADDLMRIGATYEFSDLRQHHGWTIFEMTIQSDRSSEELDKGLEEHCSAIDSIVMKHIGNLKHCYEEMTEKLGSYITVFEKSPEKFPGYLTGRACDNMVYKRPEFALLGPKPLDTTEKAKQFYLELCDLLSPDNAAVVTVRHATPKETELANVNPFAVKYHHLELKNHYDTEERKQHLRNAYEGNVKIFFDDEGVLKVIPNVEVDGELESEAEAQLDGVTELKGPAPGTRLFFLKGSNTDSEENTNIGFDYVFDGFEGMDLKTKLLFEFFLRKLQAKVGRDLKSEKGPAIQVLNTSFGFSERNPRIALSAEGPAKEAAKQINEFSKKLISYFELQFNKSALKKYYEEDFLKQDKHVITSNFLNGFPLWNIHDKDAIVKALDEISYDEFLKIVATFKHLVKNGQAQILVHGGDMTEEEAIEFSQTQSEIFNTSGNEKTSNNLVEDLFTGQKSNFTVKSESESLQNEVSYFVGKPIKSLTEKDLCIFELLRSWLQDRFRVEMNALGPEPVLRITDDIIQDSSGYLVLGLTYNSYYYSVDDMVDQIQTALENASCALLLDVGKFKRTKRDCESKLNSILNDRKQLFQNDFDQMINKSYKFQLTNKKQEIFKNLTLEDVQDYLTNNFFTDSITTIRQSYGVEGHPFPKRPKITPMLHSIFEGVIFDDDDDDDSFDDDEEEELSPKTMVPIENDDADLEDELDCHTF